MVQFHPPAPYFKMRPDLPREISQTPEVIEATEKETLKSGFAELLKIPEGSSLPVEIREDLQKAADEIAGHIYSPLAMGKQTLSKEELPDAIRRLFEEPVERAREALELFESVVKDVKGKGENIASSVVLTVKEKSETETVFLITPNTESSDYKKGQGLGQIGKTKVRKVEIVVKTAENREEQTYTPQTIKFIAQDKKGKQIENVRIEVHSTEKREGKLQYVQVDADIGGERLAKTHLDVESLGHDEEALNNFRLLQYAFLVNFTERVVAAESLSLDFGSDEHRRRFTKVVNQAKHNLDLPVEVEKVTIEERMVESEEITLEKLRQAANNVPSALVAYLRDPLYNIWDKQQNGVSGPDVVLCYLFEMEPHQVTKEEIAPFNGRATKAMEALVNFSDLNEASLDKISEDPILVQAGETILDKEQEAEFLIGQLGKLATAQVLIKSG